MGKRERIKKQQRSAEARGAGGQRGLVKLPEDFLLGTPSGMAKMSEMLKQVAAPWLAEAKTHEDLEFILTGAAIAWNLSLIAPDERREALKKVSSGRIEGKSAQWFDELIARKEELFPENRRSIEGVNVEHRGNGDFQINAVSTLDRVPVTHLPPPPGRWGWLRRLLGR
jgi:hypothetical protein